jgi:hypothetical protein
MATAGARDLRPHLVAGARELGERAREPALHGLVEAAEALADPREPGPLLPLVGVGGGGEAHGEPVEGEDERQGEGVGNHEHPVPPSLPVGLRDRSVDCVRHRQHRQRERALRVEVLHHLPDAGADVAGDLLDQPPPLDGIVGRVEPLEARRARPLAVDGQEASAGKAQRVLDDAAPEGDVRLQQVGGELVEGPGEDVLAGRSPAPGAGDDGLETPEAVGSPVQLPPAGDLQRLHLGEVALGGGEPALQTLGHVGEAAQGVLPPFLHVVPKALLGLGEPRDVGDQPLDLASESLRRLPRGGHGSAPGEDESRKRRDEREDRQPEDELQGHRHEPHAVSHGAGPRGVRAPTASATSASGG